MPLHPRRRCRPAAVGRGRAVLHDIIASGQVPVVRLDTIFRQKEGGRIVTNAHLINSGCLPVVNEDTEFRFVEIDNEADGAEKISALYNSELLETGDKFAVQSCRRCIRTLWRR